MFRTLTRLLCVAVFALVAPLIAEAKTFYWISHGSPADPVWTYFLAGANMWAKDTGKTVNTSFHNGDVASQQEAIRAAIAAKADAIVTTSPDPGSLVKVVNEAHAAGIPIINFNTPDAKVNFDAYVGGDIPSVGNGWAQYLVDHKLVKSGDFVWMPVEVPGASYGVAGRGGRDRLQAARHQVGSHRRQVRPGEGHHPHDRLPHRQPQEDQGDHRPRRPGHRLDQARVRPGRREAGRDSGRRLGQLARHDAGSPAGLRERRPVAGPAGDQLHGAVARRHGDGRHPARIQHPRGTLYEKDNAPIYDKILSGK